MRTNEPAILLSLGLLLAGCPKGAEPARGDTTPAKAPPAAANASAQGSTRMAPDTVIATWKGGKLTYGELLEKKEADFSALERKHLKERYDAEKEAVESLLVDDLVEKAAKAKNQTPEEYFKALGESQKLSDEEIQKFYNENVAGRPGAPPLEALKERITGFLMQQKTQEIVKNEVERLKTEAGLEIKMPTPDAIKVKFDLAGRPMKGPEGAKVTLVEFSDFECPYCSRATSPLKEILAAYPEQVKVYFLHFPLSFHKKAMPAAIAAQCANEQGKFWAFHDKVFDNQRELADEKLEGWASEVGLDMDKYKACFTNPETKKYVEEDMKQAELAGVRGTPSFYINGEPYAQGVPTVDAIKAYID